MIFSLHLLNIHTVDQREARANDSHDVYSLRTLLIQSITARDSLANLTVSTRPLLGASHSVIGLVNEEFYNSAVGVGMSVTVINHSKVLTASSTFLLKQDSEQFDCDLRTTEVVILRNFPRFPRT